MFFLSMYLEYTYALKWAHAYIVFEVFFDNYYWLIFLSSEILLHKLPFVIKHVIIYL